MTIQVHRITLAAGVSLAAALSAHAQETWNPADPAAGPPVILGAGETAPFRRAPAVVDDEVPAPIASEVASGPLGDATTSGPSGDPFFLGFVAGRYYPQSGERIDPLLTGETLFQIGTDARPHDEVYAFVMLKKRLTAARLDDLKDLGVRPLGLHPHYALRAAIPVAAVAEVAALPSVRWVGVARSWQKIHPHLADRLKHQPTAVHDVYISVFESDLCALSIAVDGPRPVSGGPGEPTREGEPTSAARWTSNGWMQRALEDRGVQVSAYVPRQNAFRARVSAALMSAVTALDFVQFIEADVPATADHDESMPLIYADWGRASFDGSTSQQSRVGLVDSGVDITHHALDHIYWVGWAEVDPSAAPNAYTDLCGHGSHVAGTILGQPDLVDASHRGGAPGVGTWQSGRFRYVKWLGDDCVSDSPSLSTVISHFRGNFVDAFGVSSPPPTVVNNSWGTPGTWAGTELNARVIDDEVYDEDRVFVFSAGNNGPGGVTIGLPAVAKNALTVGSIIDFRAGPLDLPGTVANGSSRGPCADFRWKPNVVAPGSSIVSVDAHTATGLVAKSGTSMAAPHVTALVAQLADQNAAMRSNPEAVMSLLQATALTKDDAVIANENDPHLDNYGAGRVNAGKLLTQNGAYWTWSSWDVDTAATITTPTYEFADFVVPAGTRRLVVCMTYVEPSSAAGASQALVHDFDLFIDAPPISGGGNTGEFTAQQSAVDNTELRIIENPTPGVWRWKSFPTSVFAPLIPAAKLAVTVVAISGDTTPTGALTVNASETYAKPGALVTASAEVSVNSYVGSAVFLESTGTPSQPTIHSATTQLIDGPFTDLEDNVHGGRDLLLGDIGGASKRRATWALSWATEGVKHFQVDALSDNMTLPSAGVDVIVDGTPPGFAGNLDSPSHQPGVWSNNSKVQLTWSAAPDNLAGTYGYSVFASTTGPSKPDEIVDTTNTQMSLDLDSKPSGWTLNVRSVDNAGNWNGGYAFSGGYLIDTELPGKVGQITSTSHPIGVWTKDKTLKLHWDPANDAHSGVAGYSLRINPGSAAPPDNTKDLPPVTDAEQVLNVPGPFWASLRSVDFAGNWDDAFVGVGPFLFDNVNPTAISGLTSTTHSPGVSSNHTLVTMQWSSAGDAHSGVAGYGTRFDPSPTAAAPTTIDTTGTSSTTNLSPSPQAVWFHVRAIDNAGNFGPTAHFGPILIGPCTGSATSATYGIGKTGTFGIPQLIATTPPALGTNAAVKIQYGYPGALPILVLGAAQISTPFDGGFLLTTPTIVSTLPVPIDGNGDLTLAGPIPFDAGLCGATFYLQALIPDPGAAGVNHLAMTPGLALTLGN